MCFPTLKTHKDKFEPRSTPHIFIGYPFNTKGYKVLHLESKKIHISRDVTFHENIFPFADVFPDSKFSSVLKNLRNNSTMLNMLDKDITKEVTNTDYSVSSPFVLDNIVGDNTQTLLFHQQTCTLNQPLPKLFLLLQYQLKHKMNQFLGDQLGHTLFQNI